MKNKTKQNKGMSLLSVFEIFEMIILSIALTIHDIYKRFKGPQSIKTEHII